jgi:hypothetical protein
LFVSLRINDLGTLFLISVALAKYTQCLEVHGFTDQKDRYITVGYLQIFLYQLNYKSNHERRKTMSIGPGELERLAVVSQQAHFRWMMGKISEVVGVNKKDLRKALEILRTPINEVKLVKNGKLVRKVFRHGFLTFFIPSGKKKREITEPHPDLQKVFVAIKDWLMREFSAHDKAYGFVIGRNCQKGVATLLNSKHFLSFDIAGAFPSVTTKMVEKTLLDLGVERDVAEALAWITTSHKGCLPQGASSSPPLLNLAFRRMCEEMEKVCQENGISWIIYVDDFNLAAPDISPELKEKLLRIPEKFGFQIKPEKTKDNLGKTIPHLLGLTIVDEKIHIKRKSKKRYRREFFHAIKSDDYSSHKARGIANAIRCIYGPEENWPGWLRKPWEIYQAKIEMEVLIR